MTLAHGFEVARPGTPVDGDGWHMPPAGLEIRFAVGRPPETGGFAVRRNGVLLATGEPSPLDGPAVPVAPGVVVLAARHLDPGEGRIRAGHRLDSDDIAALRTLLWFAAGIGEDGAARLGPVRDAAAMANALAGPPNHAGPCPCGRQLYTVMTATLAHLDGTAPCVAPLAPAFTAAELDGLGLDGEDARALAWRVPGTRPRGDGLADNRVAAGSGVSDANQRAALGAGGSNSSPGADVAFGGGGGQPGGGASGTGGSSSSGGAAGGGGGR